MRKLLTALVAVAAIGTAALATSSTADAGWGYGWHGSGYGWRGGWGWGPGPFIAGAIAAGVVGATATATARTRMSRTAIMHARACGTVITGSPPVPDACCRLRNAIAVPRAGMAQFVHGDGFCTVMACDAAPNFRQRVSV
jgi:hypothetical protein